MIEHHFNIRPTYNEVDQMGYVYHANHVSYCHQARTEMLRTMGIHDAKLESCGIMMPVISFNIQYKNPAHYDELLTITTRIKEIPKVKFMFAYEIKNELGKLVSRANSEVAFVDIVSRKPMAAPKIVTEGLSSLLPI
ncbi:acyl-CoA thioester hydrolase [Saccharicrinis carchari]|uniref:Acyl-CoA thioester hydrolase n=1 Tax=Saccharicrinis carchari TaxID=1168039 RepID=A0A521AIS9_SACCC|nr:thioesterase family protein [Saccharicrinis carchari]SMO34739.1 acyl-CoA thioester hydrolase [Saccharicrinis carchari]